MTWLLYSREESHALLTLFMDPMVLVICLFLHLLLRRLRKVLPSSWLIRSLSFLERYLYLHWDPWQMSHWYAYSYRIKLFTMLCMPCQGLRDSLYSLLGHQKGLVICKQGQKNSCAGWSFLRSWKCQPCCWSKCIVMCTKHCCIIYEQAETTTQVLNFECTTLQIYGDPDAADVVFTSGADIDVVGINITTQCCFTGLFLDTSVIFIVQLVWVWGLTTSPPCEISFMQTKISWNWKTQKGCTHSSCVTCASSTEIGMRSLTASMVYCSPVFSVCFC